MVLDTGSSFSLVSQRNVSEKDYTGGSVEMLLALGNRYAL